MVDGPEALVAGLETAIEANEIGPSQAIGGGGQVVTWAVERAGCYPWRSRS